MAEKQTWYVVVDGVLDSRVGYLGGNEDAALAVWRSSTRHQVDSEIRRAARAVPRDGRFSIVSAKTRRASAVSDTGLSLAEAIARYRQRQAETETRAVAPTVLIGDDRSHAITVGRAKDIWELTFKPSHVIARRLRTRQSIFYRGKSSQAWSASEELRWTWRNSLSYYLLYQEKPGGLLHERTDIYSGAEADAAVREALRNAEVGSYAVVWYAPHDDEHTPWQSWAWMRAQSHLKSGPRKVIRVNPVMALSAIPRQPYLDRGAEGGAPTGVRRYLVRTEMDVGLVGDQYRAAGMHIGKTYEGWGKSERAAVMALKAAIEAADPHVRISRARSRA